MPYNKLFFGISFAVAIRRKSLRINTLRQIMAILSLKKFTFFKKQHYIKIVS